MKHSPLFAQQHWMELWWTEELMLSLLFYRLSSAVLWSIINHGFDSHVFVPAAGDRGTRPLPSGTHETNQCICGYTLIFFLIFFIMVPSRLHSFFNCKFTPIKTPTQQTLLFSSFLSFSSPPNQRHNEILCTEYLSCDICFIYTTLTHGLLTKNTYLCK